MKNILVSVVSTNERNKAKQLLASVEQYLPEMEVLLCFLDAGIVGTTEFENAKTMQAAALWNGDYLNRAFFYTQDELRHVVAVKLIAKLLGQYDSVILASVDGVFTADALFLCEINQEDVLQVQEAGAPYAVKEPSVLVMDTGELSFTPGLRVFYNGPNMRRFFVWAVRKMDYFFRFTLSSILDTEHNGEKADEQLKFYANWSSYSLLFGCDVSCIEEQIWRENGKEKSEDLFAYDYFTDDVHIFPLLKPYYIKNYRLRFACKENPFANRELFTDTTVVTGEVRLPILSAVAACIYEARPDLQRAFPDAKGAGRIAYLDWFVANAGKEYELDEHYIEATKQNLEAWKEKERQKLEEQAGLCNRIKRKFGIKGAAASEAVYPQGVNLCGYIRGDFGIGEACRGLAATLEAGGVPFGIVDVATETAHTYTSTVWNHKITNEFTYKTNLMYTNADGFETFLEGVSPEALEGRYNIGYWAWELAEFPDEWCRYFDYLDEVWTLSEFAAEAIRKKSPVPVFSLPPPVVLEDVASDLTREDFGMPEDAFVFLMMYDVRSHIQRKNPQAAVKAFIKAFGEDTRARLLIKVNAPDGWDNADDIEFLEEMQGMPNVMVLNKTLERQELNRLIECADAYVSLHRSEGFGYGPAEAMYLGKPAIVTAWSGNMEYTSEETCCAVKYTLVEIEEDYGPYKKGMYWAEPDVADAAQYMKRLVDDPAYCKEIAHAGRAMILSKFSLAALGERAAKRLNKVWL